MNELYELKRKLCEALEEYGMRGEISPSSLQMIDTLAHACKNVCKIIESKQGEMYSMDGGMSGYGRSYGDMNNRGYYSSDGYYYDGEGNSTRRGRGMNGRFVSRDGSDMARQLRDMMADAPDEQTRNDIRKLVEKMESR